MSWWVASAAVAGAASKFMGSQGQSKAMKEAARDSMLTARYNINQRKLEDRKTQFDLLERGHQATSNIQRSADRAVGTATVEAGGSGAIVESGTPRAVLTNIAQEGLHAQMGAILNTKNAIKAQARQTEANNKTEWNQASAYSKGMQRDAKRTMDNARMNFATDVASAVAGGYASSLTAASTTGKVIKGAQTAKQLSDSKGGGAWDKTKPTGGVESSRWSERATAKMGFGPQSSQDWYKGRQQANKSFTDMNKVKPRDIQGYSMDKTRRTGGAESSRTSDRLWHQMKRGVEFSRAGFGRILNFTKGRVNYGGMGRGYTLLSGQGYKGTAASKKFNYRPRRRRRSR